MADGLKAVWLILRSICVAVFPLQLRFAVFQFVATGRDLPRGDADERDPCGDKKRSIHRLHGIVSRHSHLSLLVWRILTLSKRFHHRGEFL